MEGLVYLASPFFNEEQVDYISNLEKLLDTVSVPYYSPRKDGDTSEMALPAYFNELKRKLIFENNIRYINGSESMIVNLLHKDMGTSFEFGYATGRNLLEEHYDSIIVTKMRIECIPQIDMTPSTITDVYINQVDLPEDSNKNLKCYVINVSDTVSYGDAKDLLKKIIKYHKSKSDILVAVDTTESNGNHYVGAFLLGGLLKLGIKCVYISPIKSFSNLMITESGIKQYPTLSDYPKNPVIYSDNQIR